MSYTRDARVFEAVPERARKQLTEAGLRFQTSRRRQDRLRSVVTCFRCVLSRLGFLVCARHPPGHGSHARHLPAMLHMLAGPIQHLFNNYSTTIQHPIQQLFNNSLFVGFRTSRIGKVRCNSFFFFV